MGRSSWRSLDSSGVSQDVSRVKGAVVELFQPDESGVIATRMLYLFYSSYAFENPKHSAGFAPRTHPARTEAGICWSCLGARPAGCARHSKRALVRPRFAALPPCPQFPAGRIAETPVVRLDDMYFVHIRGVKGVMLGLFLWGMERAQGCIIRQW